jgi:hypothetical protein
MYVILSNSLIKRGETIMNKTIFLALILVSTHIHATDRTGQPAGSFYQGPPSTTGRVSQDPADLNTGVANDIINNGMNHPKEATTVTQTPEEKATNSFTLE